MSFLTYKNFPDLFPGLNGMGFFYSLSIHSKIMSMYPLWTFASWCSLALSHCCNMYLLILLTVSKYPISECKVLATRGVSLRGSTFPSGSTALSIAEEKNGVNYIEFMSLALSPQKMKMKDWTISKGRTWRKSGSNPNSRYKIPHEIMKKIGSVNYY